LSELPAQRAAAVTQLASDRRAAGVIELVVDPQVAAHGQRYRLRGGAATGRFFSSAATASNTSSKLTFNADASLDLYIQSDSPGKDKESNWLPAPKAAPFAATRRIYAPRPESMNGTWTPPPIKRRK
jgi:Protein of unknown function (DUF1214)